MKIIESLNLGTVEQRLDALKELVAKQKTNINRLDNDVNNHVHTFYSFSPYSPTHAAYSAYLAGLSVAGIIDHDTVSGVKEFHQAADILGLASTGGAEVRVKFPLFNKTINNPDQKGVMYMVAHAIPEKNIDAFNEYLAPYRAEREKRNIKIVKKLNKLTSSSGIELDYEKDVQSISKASEGGSVTERHVLFALAQKLLIHFDDMDDIISFVKQTFDIPVSDKQRALLNDPNNELLTYDLLGVLKTNTTKFFIPADDELPNASEFVTFAKCQGAIPAYAYLGDVKESVTGDKRAQKFEDDYLEDLIKALKNIGVPALAYMPTRNTLTQIERLQSLAKTYDMIEISGEDINSPRQSFNCDAYQDPKHQHLIDSAWALVGHEKLYALNPNQGLLGSVFQDMIISERIKYFSNYAKKVDEKR